jgi:hypothetical protein
MYLQELKSLYKNEINEEKKRYIFSQIQQKIHQSRLQWFIKNEQNNIERDLFSRMLAEVEGIKNMDINKIEIPFDETNITKPKKKLGERRDF